MSPLPTVDDLPVIAVVVDPRSGTDLVPLMAAMAPWARCRAFQPHLGAAGLLAASWRAPELARARYEVNGPLVLWAGVDEHTPAAPAGLVSEAAAVLVPPGAAAPEGARVAVAMASPGVDATAWRQVHPHVRARWRAAHGLRPDLVVTRGVRGERPLDQAAWRTAACGAAAVVAIGPAVLEALAAGAPTVTDPATAAWLATAGPAAAPDAGAYVVRTLPGAVAEAHAVAADAERAARLSWAGRRLVERHFDLSATARTVLGAFGVRAALGANAGGSPAGPAGTLRAGYDALGTPPFARVVRQGLSHLEARP